MPRALLALLLAASACAPTAEQAALQGPPETGREIVAHALEPPRRGFWSGLGGLLGTAASSLPFLGGVAEDDEYSFDAFEFELRDGTRVGGLLYEHRGHTDQPEALLIASFGLFQDRWGTEAAKILDRYLKRGSVDADVLILDHPTAGAFYASNGVLSLGAYDDARMWIEVAQYMRARLAPTAIRLAGVSMSGQTVVHALLEDARLGLGLFEMGIAMSIAPDFRTAPGAQFARLPTPESVDNPWVEWAGAPDGAGLEARLQLQALRLLITERFLPSYHRVEGSDPAFDLPTEETATFLWRAVNARLERLRRERPPDWNPQVPLSDIGAYVEATRIAVVIAEVRTPLVLLSAHDDPAVPHSQFAEVAEAAASNPWVLTHETPLGGHFAFDLAYGTDYLDRVWSALEQPEVLGDWTAVRR